MTLLAVSEFDLIPHISLAELNDLAELQIRTDRKYIVDDETVERLLTARRGDIAILDIDDRREFSYQSVYFDNSRLDLYRAAALGRRRRFKVRTRIYRDSDLAMLEVKAKDGRGRTVKNRLEYDTADWNRLTPVGQDFVDDIIGRPGFAATLAPVLTTMYRRITIVDMTSGTRATIDSGLVCTDTTGESVSLDRVIIESKSMRSASPIDRWLWSEGFRPVKISKCCTSMAAMRPELPANKWHRTLGQNFR